jgi:hypothetical protein
VAIVNAIHGFVPPWRGDETLYSWVAGFHVLCGNGSARDTGTRLFGVGHACRERQAPANLQHFLSVSSGLLGDARDILLRRTSLGLYFPFLPEYRRTLMEQGMAGQHEVNWQAQFGMSASGLTGTDLLKYCRDCVADDLRIWGLPRWRVPHQLAGCWICLDHGTLLQPLKAQTSTWLLPPTVASDTDAVSCTPAEISVLLWLARLANRLIDAAPLDMESIRQAAITGLRDQGVTGWAHPMDKHTLEQWFVGTTLSLWLQKRSGPESQLSSGAWIHSFLRNRGGDHPLKWMVLWCSLFAQQEAEASLGRFFAPVTSLRWDANGQGQIWGYSDSRLPGEITQIVANATSVAEAAKSLGMTPITLRKGLAEIGVSLGDFRFERGLDQRKEIAANEIHIYIKDHPECTRSDVHRDCKAAVSWLRRYDPRRLSHALSPIPDLHSPQFTFGFT